MLAPCQTFFLVFSRWFYVATACGRHGGTWRPPPRRRLKLCVDPQPSTAQLKAKGPVISLQGGPSLEVEEGTVEMRMGCRTLVRSKRFARSMLPERGTKACGNERQVKRICVQCERNRDAASLDGNLREQFPLAGVRIDRHHPPVVFD
jgi:hypothetical protein